MCFSGQCVLNGTTVTAISAAATWAGKDPGVPESSRNRRRLKNWTTDYVDVVDDVDDNQDDDSDDVDDNQDDDSNDNDDDDDSNDNDDDDVDEPL